MLENAWVMKPYREDNRPVIGKCEYCHDEIRGANGIYGSDAHYDFPEGKVHYDCLHKFFKDYLVPEG